MYPLVISMQIYQSQGFHFSGFRKFQHFSRVFQQMPRYISILFKVTLKFFLFSLNKNLSFLQVTFVQDSKVKVSFLANFGNLEGRGFIYSELNGDRNGDRHRKMGGGWANRSQPLYWLSCNVKALTVSYIPLVPSPRFHSV